MALGLLFLVSCVVLVGVLTVRDSQDAGRIAQILGIVFGVLGPAILLVSWWRRGTAPMARQPDAERESLAGAIAQQWRQEALARSLGDPVPIPVLLSLAEWDPTDQPEPHTWLAGKLAKDYPSLRAAGPHMAETLAKQGHLLPILDGLDELPRPRRPEVIAALNKSLADTDQLVLTSRTTEYTTARPKHSRSSTARAGLSPKS